MSEPLEPTSWYLPDLTQPDAERLIKASRTAIYPGGSVEQHGPHLPLGTDYFAAFHLARGVARRMRAPILPSPLVGVAAQHLTWAGSLTIRQETSIAFMEDLIGSLAPHGLERLLILNWHEGNTPTLRLGADRVQRRFGVRVVVAEGHVITNKLFGDEVMEFTHCGSMETNAMLAYDPELVHLERANNPSDFEQGMAAHNRLRRHDVYPVLLDFHEVAETGWYGHPEKASLETAREWQERVADYIVEHALPLFELPWPASRRMPEAVR